MSDVFISYASEDRSRAQALAEALEQEGWSIWWDRTILPGKTFDEVIETELKAARCVIVIWSETSVGSSWVRAEAGDALTRGILVPVLVEEAEIPLVFRQIQAAPMLDWKGENTHSGFQQLIKAIESRLGTKDTAHGTDAEVSPEAELTRLRKKALETKSLEELRSIRGEVEGLLEHNPKLADGAQLRNQIDRAIETLSSSTSSKETVAVGRPVDAQEAPKSSRSSSVLISAVAVVVLLGIAVVWYFTSTDLEKAIVGTEETPDRVLKNEVHSGSSKEPLPTQKTPVTADRGQIEDKQVAPQAEPDKQIPDAAERTRDPESERRLEAERLLKLREQQTALRAQREKEERRLAELIKKRKVKEEVARRQAEEEMARRQAEEEMARRRAEEDLHRQETARAQEEQQAEIERLLLAAETDLGALRLTTPEGNNAVERYRSVMALDPGNAKAQRGLRTVGRRYLELARQATSENRFDRAGEYLNKAQEFLGEDETIAATRGYLAEAITRAEQLPTREPEPMDLQPEIRPDEQLARSREDNIGMRPPPESRPLRLAVLPFETTASCHLPRKQDLLDVVESLVKHAGRLELEYSFYDDERNELVAPNRNKIWVRGEPNADLVLTIGQALGVDLVFMAIIDCADSPNVYDDHYYFEAYLADIQNERLIKKEGIVSNMARITKDLILGFR